MTSKTIVLISGANQGLGFEIAKKLATEHQDYHILLGSRSLAKGEESAKKLHGLPGSIQAVQLDVTSDDSIAACADLVKTQFGHLDVLINNAGIATPAYEHEPTLRAKLSRCFDTNLYGAAALTDACIPLLKLAANPRIVFMSSEMGSVSNTLDPNFPYYGIPLHNFDAVAYKASKAALNMLGATYAVKYGGDGFKVNLCCPGLRKTNLVPAMGDLAGEAAEGAVNACRLATLGKEGDFYEFGGGHAVVGLDGSDVPSENRGVWEFEE